MTKTKIDFWTVMHNDENGPYFDDLDSQDFADVVTDILNDDNFEISIKTVKTTDGTSYGENTTLRLKHSNSDYSSNYKDAIVESQKPVVLARGLWSNLFTWEDFAKELASEGRDSWLIEITGGPTQDCETCPNYEYEDLVDYFWPALIAGVEHYSGQNTIDYIGFSNGCRVALDSLKNWSSPGKNNAGYCFNTETGLYDIDCDLASNPVDTFVGVGCPGAFENESLYSHCWKKYSDELRDRLNSETHISAGDMGKALTISTVFNLDPKCTIAGSLSSVSGGSISFNLADKYLTFIESSSDSQPGGNININRSVLIRGTVPIPTLVTLGIPITYTKTDLVVTKEDMDSIYSNINANEKFYYISVGAHSAPISLLGLADSLITRSIVKDLVNGKDSTKYESLLLNST